AEICRQIAASRFPLSPDRRERGRQIPRGDLVDAGRIDALEKGFAGGGQLEWGLQEGRRQPPDPGGRNQDLIGVGGALQSRSRWQSWAKEVVIPPRSRQARVDAKSYLKPSGGPPGNAAHLALRLDRGHHGVQRPVENRQHTVASTSKGV